MSYIVMSAAEVTKLASTTTARVETYRSEYQDYLIRNKLKKMEQNLLRRFIRFIFRAKPYTREDAIYSLKEENWGIAWNRSSYLLSDQMEVAQKLLNLAYRGDPVYVTADDLDEIT